MKTADKLTNILTVTTVLAAVAIHGRLAADNELPAVTPFAWNFRNFASDECVPQGAYTWEGFDVRAEGACRLRSPWHLRAPFSRASITEAVRARGAAG